MTVDELKAEVRQSVEIRLHDERATVWDCRQNPDNLGKEI
jgi:hypothetical protein